MTEQASIPLCFFLDRRAGVFQSFRLLLGWKEAGVIPNVLRLCELMSLRFLVRIGKETAFMTVWRSTSHFVMQRLVRGIG
jgi:hypothetical protein